MEIANFYATYYGPVSALFLTVLMWAGIWVSIVSYRFFAKKR